MSDWLLSVCFNVDDLESIYNRCDNPQLKTHLLVTFLLYYSGNVGQIDVLVILRCLNLHCISCLLLLNVGQQPRNNHLYLSKDLDRGTMHCKQYYPLKKPVSFHLPTVRLLYLHALPSTSSRPYDIVYFMGTLCWGIYKK